MFEKELEEYKNQPKWKGKIFMTDEEICFKDGIELGYNKANECLDERYSHDMGARKPCKEAFLAGLKAGKQEKWHKVSDGDYPPCEKDGFTINVLTDRGEIAYYNLDFDYWIEEPASVEIDPPKAWCEIPKYSEQVLVK